MSAFDQELWQALKQRQSEQRYRQRYRLAPQNHESASMQVEGRDYLGFCHNDYLGLSHHPSAIASLQQAAERGGVGSGASHLVYGHSDYHHQLEDAIAEFTGRERALLFSTGYMANLGVVSALTRRGDTVYEDRLNHASLIDAGLLSRAQVKRFRHNDMMQLEQWLVGDDARRKLVVVDGVFSMDGDLAPLPELVKLCHRYQAQLMVDDAHGFGVLGHNGGGCAEYFQLNQQDLPVLVGTLGKALGTFGAFVAGSEALIETLIQFSRTYIYTTALPPAVAAATQTNLSIVKQEHHRREHLHAIIQYFREQARGAGLPLKESLTPIQPLILGDDALVMQVAAGLREQGMLVGAIRPPTVPEGTARLRITLNALHTREDIDRLISVLVSVWNDCHAE